MPNPFMALWKLQLDLVRQWLSLTRSLLDAPLGAPPMPSASRAVVPVRSPQARRGR